MRLASVMMLLILSCVARAELNPSQMQTYQTLIQETRCVTCQNQNIAESNAPVAEAMRDIILEKLEQGMTEAEIRQFLIERYGEYVSFKPSFNAKNIMLWMTPWLGLIFAAIFLLRTTRRRPVV